MRINKWIAESGFCSRREADRLIEAGRVAIDGQRAVLGDKVLEHSAVTVDGKPVTPRKKSDNVYIALHKPVGIVCTADPREPMNVIDYLGYPERVFPIGRLDKDSAGLLLLTSDGDIVNKILRAVGKHEKEYVVTVNRPVTPEFLKSMREGVAILDTVTLPCKIEMEGRFRFRLTLVQGLNRQIRRMCEALGYRVNTLRRERIMNIELGDMASGEWRFLTEDELSELMRQIG